jgi:bifunctional UDP-N-acetylglucosamine pyrophosphorylase / glucosamine-1-phosphate N-acetyltransferase
VIGAGSILRDVVVEEDVTLQPYTVARETRIAKGAIVGPFTHTRPGSEIGPGAHVGNFVELKKTRLGKGSKASHLSYLGDAEIGQDVNIGAGTITCNYDGRHKHPTRIGDRAFIGSDSILVAPIEIGDDAYVAAGSTLTDPVPSGALALGRARQTNKEGWVARRALSRQEKEVPSARPSPKGKGRPPVRRAR